MCMWVIFIILLYIIKKTVHAHNYTFFWKGLCFIYLISFYGSKFGLFECNLFWVGQYEPSPPFILEEKLMQYLYNFIQFLSNLSKIIPSQKTADIIL